MVESMSHREVGQVTDDGLIKGHAYAITDTEQVMKSSDEILLLRLRNPWGFVEYRGPWSDRGKEWNDVDAAEKKRIELKKKEDGEFWISADDLSRLFDIVELCSVNPDTLVEGNNPASPTSPASPSTWTISEHEGRWAPGSSAGGSRRYRKSFWKNPQFELSLTEQDKSDDEDDDDEDDGGDDEDDVDSNGGTGAPSEEEKKRAEKKEKRSNQCTVLVELLQKNRRQKGKVHFLYIAFHIYKISPELQGMCLTRNFFMKTAPVGRSGKYKAQRGVWRKLHLDPGNYIIVASTYRPNQQGEFFVRIFSKTGNTLGTQDFTCSFNFLPVMAAPVLPEDHIRVQKTFDEAAGSDDKLNAKDLMKLFNSALDKDYHLPLETCRQLIFGEDSKGRSSLSRKQAETLLSSLRSLQSIFFQFDEDSSGAMSPFEFSSALEAVGMQCDGKIVQLLSERFASGELHMPFHSFVSCVTRLRKLFALYESESSQEVKDRGINAWLLQFLTV